MSHWSSSTQCAVSGRQQYLEKAKEGGIKRQLRACEHKKRKLRLPPPPPRLTAAYNEQNRMFHATANACTAWRRATAPKPLLCTSGTELEGIAHKTKQASTFC